MPYRAAADEVELRPQHARPSTTVALGGPRKLGHVNCLTGQIEAGTRFYSEVLGMAVAELAAWRRGRLVSRQHRPPRDGLGQRRLRPLSPPLAFETVDIGKMRGALLDHLARHGRWLGWGPTRHGIAGNIASYVRIVEEECFVELYCDMEQLQRAPRSAPLPGRSVLVQHLGPAASALVLPLRRGRDRVRAPEPLDARRDARPRPSRRGRRATPG